MRTKLIAALIALTFAGSAGAALAHGKTACTEAGRGEGMLTHPVHHAHEPFEGTVVGDVVHDQVEPETCEGGLLYVPNP
jgi:hypothetical protein